MNFASGRSARYALRGANLVVDDLDAARDRFSRIGFNVGSRVGDDTFSVRTISFSDSYLWLLSGPRMPPEERTTLREGLEGVLVADTEADDHSDLRSSPHLTGEIRPDSYLSDIGFGYVGGSHPVVDPTSLRHVNSVSGIAGLVIVARNPSDHHIFLSKFTGQRELRATSAGITASTRGGDIAIVDPTAFRGLYGVDPPDVSNAARLAAARLKVSDRAALTATLRAAVVPYSAHMGHIVVGPETAMGATLVFEPADS